MMNELDDKISESFEILFSFSESRDIEKHPQVVADYKAGKGAALQFLVGQGMKETKGSANPNVLREVFLKILG